MKKLHELFRLKYRAKLSHRQIASSLSISAGTVSHYSKAFNQSGLSYEAILDLSDDELLERLLPFCERRQTSKTTRMSLPNFAELHQAIKQKGVNRQLLYEEHQAKHPEQAYSYSQFCRDFKAFSACLKPSLRQTHKAGEQCFIDYCGPRIPLYDANGQVTARAYVFVGCLGASNYTFATASLTRNLADWIGANVAMLEFFGGVPEMLVPDNEKSGVKDACYYDPDVNPTYADFAKHYDVVVLPTRPAHPKDKAKAEKAVQVVETWIIAKLRHQKFRSLAALNTAIAALLDELNARPFKQLPGSRLSMFQQLEQPALKPLPKHRYELAYFQSALVRLDYHIQVDKHHYSVPHRLIRETLDVRLTRDHIECFYQSQCVARHVRSYKVGGYTTSRNHMPSSHRYHQQWTPEQFSHFATLVGPACELLVEQEMLRLANPQRCHRLHTGFRHLLTTYGATALEQACAYALDHDVLRFKSIQSILKRQMTTSTTSHGGQLPQQHEHVRGANAYTTQ